MVLAVFQESDDFASDPGQRSTGTPDLGRLFRTGIQDVNRLSVGNHTPCPSLYTTVVFSQRAWNHVSSTVSLPHHGVAPSPAPAGLHPRCRGAAAGLGHRLALYSAKDNGVRSVGVGCVHLL